MIFATLHSIICLLCLLGWGFAFSRLFRFEVKSLGVLLLSGFCGLSFLGSLIHLFIPLSPIVSVSLIATGILLVFRKSVLKSLRGFSRLPIFFVIALFGMALIYMFALQLPYDSGLYHIQFIKWLQQHNIVLGLGNVHDRFSANSVNWIWSAIFHPWEINQPYLDVSHLVFYLSTLICFFSFWSNKQALSQIGAFLYSGVFLWGIPILLEQLGSPANDISIGFLWLLCFFFLSLSLIREDLTDSERREIDIALILIGALSLMVKPSGVFMVLIWFIYPFFRVSLVAPKEEAVGISNLKIKLERIKEFIFSHRGVLVFAGIVGFLHFLRTFLISGCWLFPSEQSCVPNVFWKISTQNIHESILWIKSWARAPEQNPNEVLANWSWLGPWWGRTWEFYPLNESVRMIFAMGVISCGLSFYRKGTKKEFVVNWGPLLILFWGLGAVAFWFLTAPDLRFASGLFAGLTGFLVAWFLSSHSKIWKYLFSILFVVLLVKSSDRIFKEIHRFQDNLWVMNSYLQSPSTGYSGGVFVTPAGLRLNVPDNFPSNDQCWFAPLPCTPKPHDGLNSGKWYGFTFYSVQK